MENERQSQACEAIRKGDVETLTRLLAEDANLSRVYVRSACDETASRTLLHVATDWPGDFPNKIETVKALIAEGADVNAQFVGQHRETPLHLAASSDDVACIDVLLDAGADIEAEGGVIGNGTPLADAVAFGQWNAARRLIERGATANLWQSAALGLMDRVESFFTDGFSPTSHDVTNAFWCACHGGQRETAEYLLARGADLNWVGHDRLTPIDTARRSGASELVDWLVGVGAQSVSY